MTGSDRSTGERFGVFVVSCGFQLLHGLMFMLAVGVIHHEWIPACPTLGYWWSVLLAALIRSTLYQVDFNEDKKHCRLPKKELTA